MDENKRINELLPIGSIVKLKDGEKRLMIMAVMQMQNNKVFDYMGVLYPEGYVGAKSSVLFNCDGIEQVVWRGYEDQEREVYLDFLRLAWEAGRRTVEKNEENTEEK